MAQPKIRTEFVASGGNAGTFNQNSLIPTDKVAHPGMSGVMDAAIATTKSFLYTELEKRDNIIREPLSNFPYRDDIRINVSNTLDWAELYSYRHRDYGLTNGAGEGPVQATISTEIPVIQADIAKEYFKTHVWEVAMRINYFDLAKGAITGASIEEDLRQGIRYAYDMHLNLNTYMGLPSYGTEGLLNQSEVIATNLSNGAAGTPDWASKTPLEIYNDLNQMVYETWAAAGFDPRAIPNHITMPYSLLSRISTLPNNELSNMTILTFFEGNNFANSNGVRIKVTANPYAETAGAGGTTRIAVYNDERYFLGMDILAPLTRIMFDSNTEKVSYDSLYASNITEVMLFYPNTMRYYDGA